MIILETFKTGMNILIYHMSEKVLISKIYINLVKLNNNKMQTIPLKRENR